MSITVKRPQGTVEFCTNLDLRADWENAVDALEAAKNTPRDRMVDTEVVEAAAVVNKLQEQMNDDTVNFRLSALPRKRWQELSVENEPRKGNTSDERMGINTATFFDAVMREPGTVISVLGKATGDVVDFVPATEWDALADEMTDGQYNEFVNKLIELNRGSTAVPFSRTALLMTRGSELISSSPNGSESASSD